jgi:DnaJ family protein C protein 28
MKDPFNRISDKEQIDRLRRENAEREWRSAVDRLIDEAQQKGVFDDLPGKGKPLKLRKNPYAGDQALAYEILENNNYTLPWIADRNELLAAIDAFRAALRQRWSRYQTQLDNARTLDARHALRQEWMRSLIETEAEIAALNKRIARLNLKIPVERLEILKLQRDRELRRIGATR